MFPGSDIDTMTFCLITYGFRSYRHFILLESLIFRMKHGVMVRICRFMAQQVAIRSRVEVFLIRFLALLAEGKGDCRIRIRGLDGFYQGYQDIVCKVTVFSSLEHKGAETKFMTDFATS